MTFRNYTERIKVFQHGADIFLYFRGSWHACQNDGNQKTAFRLWGDLNPHEVKRIKLRMSGFVRDQVFIESFRNNEACVLCLPVNPRLYLEYDVVDANGMLQQTRLDPDTDPFEKRQIEPSRQTAKKVKSTRHFLIHTDYRDMPSMQRSCFFMSDGTFRYVPGAIRPMLD